MPADEPRNNAFVVWFDHNGDPCAVYYRDDEGANLGGDVIARWVRACQEYGDPEDYKTWDDLCDEMSEVSGPHLLTLAGEL